MFRNNKNQYKTTKVFKSANKLIIKKKKVQLPYYNPLPKAYYADLKSSDLQTHMKVNVKWN